MPAFNAAAFIDEALRSALSQTWSDLEVIVADDGSTDDTLELARRWISIDRRVSVLPGRGVKGVSAARNRAMSAARGRYFAMLDSDDAWMPRYLAVQMAVFDAFTDAAIVAANAVSVGGPLDGQLYRPDTGSRQRLTFLDLIEREDAIGIMSVLRREVFEAIGGMDETIGHNEDYEFWLRAAAAGFVIIQTPEPLVRYRRRAAGASADELQMLDGIIKVLTRARGWCDGQSPDGGTDRWQAERQAIDRQVDRFARESLAVRAKNALRSGDFDTASALFEQLSRRDPRILARVAAISARIAPRSVWWADRLRTSMRRWSLP
jgi:glycosyltransferase involved in cell wall biosynthesis